MSRKGKLPRASKEANNEVRPEKRGAFGNMSASVSFQVSICKFKFTGGARPSLEEKKTLRVDSGGNFRYSSGAGDRTVTAFEMLPREQVARSNAGTIITDRFAAITADKFGTSATRSAAATTATNAASSSALGR